MSIIIIFAQVVQQLDVASKGVFMYAQQLALELGFNYSIASGSAKFELRELKPFLAPSLMDLYQNRFERFVQHMKDYYFETVRVIHLDYS